MSGGPSDLQPTHRLLRVLAAASGRLLAPRCLASTVGALPGKDQHGHRECVSVFVCKQSLPSMPNPAAANQTEWCTTTTHSSFIFILSRRCCRYCATAAHMLLFVCLSMVTDTCLLLSSVALCSILSFSLYFSLITFL